MRVALFANGGEIPELALQALAGVGTVVAIVRARPPGGLRSTVRRIGRRLLRGPASSDSLSRLAAECGIPEWSMHGSTDTSVRTQLIAAKPDLVCIATFPWRLESSLLDVARLGGVNLHASILPRHRGPNPWFWTYHADDREAGVTVHVCTPRLDGGAIVAQSRWPLARGRAVGALHRQVAEQGAALLTECVPQAERRIADAWPQSEASATRAPRVRPGTPMLDGSWTAERTWHFLAGLIGQYEEPLKVEGRALRYVSVRGHELADPEGTPGQLEREGQRGAWRLWCRDGFVRLEERDA